MAIRVRRGSSEETLYIETLLDALAKFREKPRKNWLMFIHRHTGVAYWVEGFTKSGETLLRAPNGVLCHPKITERECRFYYPLWR
jgi:hypothetical protein